MSDTPTGPQLPPKEPGSFPSVPPIPSPLPTPFTPLSSASILDDLVTERTAWQKNMINNVSLLRELVLAIAQAVRDIEQQLGNVPKTAALQELSEKLKAREAELEQLQSASASTEAFAKQQIEILTTAQRAIGIEGRVGRLEEAAGVRQGAKLQKTSNWLATVGIVIAIALGVVSIAFQLI